MRGFEICQFNMKPNRQQWLHWKIVPKSCPLKHIFDLPDSPVHAKLYIIIIWWLVSKICIFEKVLHKHILWVQKGVGTVLSPQILTHRSSEWFEYVCTSGLRPLKKQSHKVRWLDSESGMIGKALIKIGAIKDNKNC